MKYRLSNAITLDEQKLGNEKIEQVLPDIKLNPNLVMGTIGGLATSFLIIMTWLVLSNATGSPVSIMLLTIGVAVGKSIRISGAGYSRWYGIAAVMITFVSGLSGIIISSLGLIAYQQVRGLSEVFSWLSVHSSLEVLYENINPLKMLYLVVGSFTSYRLAVKTEE